MPAHNGESIMAAALVKNLGYTDAEAVAQVIAWRTPDRKENKMTAEELWNTYDGVPWTDVSEATQAMYVAHAASLETWRDEIAY